MFAVLSALLAGFFHVLSGPDQLAGMAGFSTILGKVADRWTGSARGFYRGLLWSCASAALGVGTGWLVAGASRA